MQKGTKFKDLEFPPDSDSISPYENAKDNERMHTACKWEYPSHTADRDKNWCLFRSPQSSDIVQGFLGNCW